MEKLLDEIETKRIKKKDDKIHENHDTNADSRHD